MILKLDLQSETPIYIQLKMQIIEGIATGSLVPGEPLPSVRQLASDLGINLHTVNKAYTMLKQDGFIIIHRQKGVVVSSSEDLKVTDEYLSQLKSNIRPIITEAFCRGMTIDEFSIICKDIFTELGMPQI
ncbi:GntR family transcriptional regulator [Pseudobacteroides cellulosolvens]|uniref:Transcriptional regulator, GntR family n=1 Tax=Pseudobacteroides cellulosolvens ATCC 35603 = DSM 2933 TaxID=398512 RepID=A0A0L6JRL6_9FIRM|nr:GntR family transcriptional regulator [Pseudobacteroides cellulosolvens]KNY28330.1 transcriptional regulator, GntR family [Pseudobacteroides cellulosolvens ATCC 35603 = DSM 2933]